MLEVSANVRIVISFSINQRIQPRSCDSNQEPLPDSPVEVLEHVHVGVGVDGELVDEVGDDGGGHPLPGVDRALDIHDLLAGAAAVAADLGDALVAALVALPDRLRRQPVVCCCNLIQFTLMRSRIYMQLVFTIYIRHIC